MQLGWKFAVVVSCLVIVKPHVQCRSLVTGSHERSERANRFQLPLWFSNPFRRNGPGAYVKGAASQPVVLGELKPKGAEFGQISGVAVDQNGNPVIFHRGQTVWDISSFRLDNKYNKFNEGPIKENTIVTLDGVSGEVLKSWGSGMFYMPHGLTIDAQGNTWVTDVALHQVMKFANGSTTPSLVLGEASVPGGDDAHFCKPTDVAVAANGIFFVADGYCNKRILKYSPNGELIDKVEGSVHFNVPHSLALFEETDKLCIADRENERVVCMGAGLHSVPFGRHVTTTKSSSLGRVFAIAPLGQNILAVTGPTPLSILGFGSPAKGFTIDANTQNLIGDWAPRDGFKNPHDVAVTPEGIAYIVEIGPNRISKFSFAGL